MYAHKTEHFYHFQKHNFDTLIVKFIFDGQQIAEMIAEIREIIIPQN